MRTDKIAFKMFELDLDYEKSMERYKIKPFRNLKQGADSLVREFVDLLDTFVIAEKGRQFSLFTASEWPRSMPWRVDVPAEMPIVIWMRICAP